MVQESDFQYTETEVGEPADGELLAKASQRTNPPKCTATGPVI